MSSQYLYTDSLLPMVADSAPLVKSLQCKWSDSLHYSLGINVKSCKLGPTDLWNFLVNDHHKFSEKG